MQALTISNLMLLGLLLGLQPALAPALQTPSAPRRDALPDVLMIILDDVAASDVELVATPNIDWLASQGVAFRRAYAAPVCVPTRHALFFGQYQRSGLGVPCRNIEPEAPDHAQISIPKLLKARGYATAAFGKWHLGSNRLGGWEITPHLHGFDHWLAGSPDNVSQCGGLNYNDWLRVDDGKSAFTQEYHTTAVRDALLSWWQSTSGPRFAYVGLQAPHVPLHQPPAALLPTGYPVATTDRERYEALLVSADWVIGEILGVVDARTTWIFVLGDNGTPPEGVRAGQSTARVKGSTFEDGVRVPFVVSGPGITRPFETEALVHGVDCFATIAELAGAGVPPRSATDSVSFVPCLKSPEARVRQWVFCDWNPQTTNNVAKQLKRRRALITERWKLRRVGDTIEELYDLERDPNENRPLDPNAPEYARIAAELGAKLNALE